MSLSSEERTEIEAIIKVKISETEANIVLLRELTKPIAPDSAIGRVSRMDAINNKSVNDAGLRSAQSKLEKLQRNLRHVHNADFGNCSKCGNPIQIGRLKYMPESGWCIHCARKR